MSKAWNATWCQAFARFDLEVLQPVLWPQYLKMVGKIRNAMLLQWACLKSNDQSFECLIRFINLSRWSYYIVIGYCFIYDHVPIFPPKIQDGLAPLRPLVALAGLAGKTSTGASPCGFAWDVLSWGFLTLVCADLCRLWINMIYLLHVLWYPSFCYWTWMNMALNAIFAIVGMPFAAGLKKRPLKCQSTRCCLGGRI